MTFTSTRCKGPHNQTLSQFDEGPGRCHASRVNIIQYTVSIPALVAMALGEVPTQANSKRW